ncbi:hypothetical protein ACN4EK_01105 [Pantanalinema rosaneae CENA516]
MGSASGRCWGMLSVGSFTILTILSVFFWGLILEKRLFIGISSLDR